MMSSRTLGSPGQEEDSEEVTVEDQEKVTEVAAQAGRRSLLQIKIDILRVVAQGSGKPTQMMYKANLSWRVLQTQLKYFLESGLLTVEEYGSRRRYYVTPKGIETMKAFDKVEAEMSSPAGPT